MADKQNIKKQKKSPAMAALGYTVGNLLVKGLAFITIPVFSRVMATSDYGIYSTFMAYASVLTIFVGLALHASVKNALYDFKDKLADYSSSVALLVIFNTIFLLTVLLCFIGPVSRLTGFSSFMLILLIFESFGNAFLTFYNSKLALDYMYGEYLYISAFHAVTSIALSLLLIRIFPLGKAYAGRIIGGTVPIILVAAYILFRLFRDSRPRINLHYWKYGCKISLPLIPHGLSQIILSQFDRIMINNTIGPSDAGLYSFAYNVGIILQVISTSLDTVWTPWFFEKYSKGDIDTIRKVSSKYVMMFSGITSLLLLISPELIMLLGSRDYWPGKYAVIPIVLSMFFSFMYTLPSIVEYFYKRTHLIAAGTVFAAVLNIILNMIFIPLYGYSAAAYTTLTCYILYFFFHIIIAHKIAGMHVYDMKMLMLYCGIVCLIAVFSRIFIDFILLRFVLFTVLFAVGCIVLFKNKEMIVRLIKRK